MATIRELKNDYDRACRGWRSRPNGSAEIAAASASYLARGEKARLRLPFQTDIAYAYSPRENVGSGGAAHITVTENVKVGRFERKKGSALCQPPSKKFWGLEWGVHKVANCLKCLEIAEKLTND